jgi:hypothetical protein
LTNFFLGRKALKAQRNRPFLAHKHLTDYLLCNEASLPIAWLLGTSKLFHAIAIGDKNRQNG